MGNRYIINTAAGVAELADAQDLGFNVTRASNLLTDTQHYTALSMDSFVAVAKLRFPAHSFSSLGYR